jgi:hypothetical protein
MLNRCYYKSSSYKKPGNQNCSIYEAAAPVDYKYHGQIVTAPNHFTNAALISRAGLSPKTALELQAISEGEVLVKLVTHIQRMLCGSAPFVHPTDDTYKLPELQTLVKSSLNLFKRTRHFSSVGLGQNHPLRRQLALSPKLFP